MVMIFSERLKRLNFHGFNNSVCMLHKTRNCTHNFNFISVDTNIYLLWKFQCMRYPVHGFWRLFAGLEYVPVLTYLGWTCDQSHPLSHTQTEIVLYGYEITNPDRKNIVQLYIPWRDFSIFFLNGKIDWQLDTPAHSTSWIHFTCVYLWALRITIFHMVVQLRPLDAYNARNLNNIRSLFLQVKQTVEYVYIIYNI